MMSAEVDAGSTTWPAAGGTRKVVAVDMDDGGLMAEARSLFEKMGHVATSSEPYAPSSDMWIVGPGAVEEAYNEMNGSRPGWATTGTATRKGIVVTDGEGETAGELTISLLFGARETGASTGTGTATGNDSVARANQTTTTTTTTDTVGASGGSGITVGIPAGGPIAGSATGTSGGNVSHSEAEAEAEADTTTSTEGGAVSVTGDARVVEATITCVVVAAFTSDVWESSVEQSAEVDCGTVQWTEMDV
jgi:hypothetical protein